MVIKDMESKKTLKELFESRKEELANKLKDFSLPKDASLVQSTVTNYLNDLFDSDGEFRQNLTQSEDYILQAAMSLLNAQQSMIGEFSKVKISADQGGNNDVPKSEPKTIGEYGKSLKKEQYPFVIGGSAVGGAAGALIFGTWGAVFGAIAGTALVLYCSSQFPQQSSKSKVVQPSMTTPKKAEVKEEKIDVEIFVGIVANICESVDSLIQTFRAQINRVVDKYENIEKPTLERDYGVLLERIQSLLGASYQPLDERRQNRIESYIEQLAESLENYDLEVVKYDANTKSYFIEVNTNNVEVTTMVLPAIVKQGKVIKKGKVFIKG